MSWQELIGQPLVARLLRGAVGTNRVSHAYLFSGPAGLGKHAAGLLLARALNCLEPPAPGESCDRCLACRKIIGGVHPDVLMVQPAGREIQIWQVTQRDETDRKGVTAVRSFLALRPGEARWKVVVMADADSMNDAAANALLKSLEEPPGYGVLVLTTTNPAGILPTIRSRCQQVGFPPAPLPAVVAELERDGVPAEQARLLAALSGGSLGQARALVGDENLSRRRNETRELLARLPDLDDAGLLEQVDELERRKEELPEWLDLMLMWLRDGLVLAETGRSELVAAADEAEFVGSLARLGPVRLLEMVDQVAAARAALDRNANARLVLDVMLLKLGNLTQTGTLST